MSERAGGHGVLGTLSDDIVASLRVAISGEATGWLWWFVIGAAFAGTVGVWLGVAVVVLLFLWSGSVRFFDACFDGARAGLAEPMVQWRETPDTLGPLITPGLVLIGLVVASLVPAVLVFEAFGGAWSQRPVLQHAATYATAGLSAVPIPVLIALAEDRRSPLAALDLVTAARVIYAAGWRYLGVVALYLFVGSAPAALFRLASGEPSLLGFVAACIGVIVSVIAGSVGLGATGAAMGRLVRDNAAVARAFDGQPPAPRGPGAFDSRGAGSLQG